MSCSLIQLHLSSPTRLLRHASLNRQTPSVQHLGRTHQTISRTQVHKTPFFI